MKKLFLGIFLGLFLSYSLVTHAQLIDVFTPIEVKNVDIVGQPLLSKADIQYSATTTVATKLPEVELLKVKENYNNTDRIVSQLQELNQRLIYLTQVISKK